VATNKQDDIFIREFLLVLGGLVAYTVLALLLSRAIGAAAFEASQMKPEEVAQRIEPVGEVRYGEAGEMPEAVAEAEAATAEAAASEEAPTQVAAASSGDQIYQSLCIACHQAGVAGAPKLDDQQAWSERATQGFDALKASVINGKGAMPPRAGNPSLTDEEIGTAIRYMLEQAGVETGS